MNLNQFVSLKMGNKFLFKEPLQSLKFLRNQNIQQGNRNNMNNMNNNWERPNYYSPNNINNKRNYEGMDVIPKFIANENMKEINNELLDRILKKKGIFIKMMKNYFSEGEDFFSNSIMEIESEMNRYKDIQENNKNNDFEGFKDLLSFINNNRTNPNLASLQNISINDYKNMNYDTKKIVLGGIYENRPKFALRLNLKNYENYQNPAKQRANSFSNNKINMANKRPSNLNLISQEQISLFKTFVGNQNISDNHVLSYFDVSNPKVVIAANKYFKNIYGTEYLTLYYYYPTKAQSGTKIHKFRFTSEISDLFMGAQNDYLSMVNPRLILENGKEIVNDRKIKCIGALNLSNNSKIKVLSK